LTSSVYCSTGTTCLISPSQQADIGNAMKASFGIDPKQSIFKGVMLYKLQRKCAAKIDSQSNHNTASIKDIATNICLLVVWNTADYLPKFCVCLIEYADDFTWDEDKLWTLYWKYDDQFCEDYRSSTTTWLIHSDTVMKIRRDITYGSDYQLDIVMSEGTGKYNMKRPIQIDPKRSVLPL
jgi:hypothetical protein